MVHTRIHRFELTNSTCIDKVLFSNQATHPYRTIHVWDTSSGTVDGRNLKQPPWDGAKYLVNSQINYLS